MKNREVAQFRVQIPGRDVATPTAPAVVIILVVLVLAALLTVAGVAPSTVYAALATGGMVASSLLQQLGVIAGPTRP
ncbi:uncharacterized membrane protein YgaE (UPF0421/DUF939 family) [Kitasatospora sp. MAA4]|uniref:hypothetical protein n=1 Tax=Kitasatospora sp. MAA4 TaxID=3035093 RepID=UPI0024743E40|nr:hypothetical protein [Kitasatospora sp. MAA4]MDH6132840.1 uncharacterized membrane protein YgaE (UPF0421/DUF939 family) [Kitasatospora sp. MAA4]